MTDPDFQDWTALRVPGGRRGVRRLQRAHSQAAHRRWPTARIPTRQARPRRPELDAIMKPIPTGGNRPPRRYYTLTDQGRAELDGLLQAASVDARFRQLRMGWA